jgi:hypothetical protein
LKKIIVRVDSNYFITKMLWFSRFAIEVGGQLFVAYVKEKEAAWREYQEAISEGKTAGTHICPYVHMFIGLQFLLSKIHESTSQKMYMHEYINLDTIIVDPRILNEVKVCICTWACALAAWSVYGD